jgi:hypothetical protein
MAGAGTGDGEVDIVLFVPPPIAMPEPASLALLAPAAMGFFGLRGARRRSMIPARGSCPGVPPRG